MPWAGLGEAEAGWGAAVVSACLTEVCRLSLSLSPSSSHTHTHTLSLSLSLSLTHTHSLPLSLPLPLSLTGLVAVLCRALDYKGTGGKPYNMRAASGPRDCSSAAVPKARLKQPAASYTPPPMRKQSTSGGGRALVFDEEAGATTATTAVTLRAARRQLIQAADPPLLQALKAPLESGQIVSHSLALARGRHTSDGVFGTLASEAGSALVHSLLGLLGQRRYTCYTAAGQQACQLKHEPCYQLQAVKTTTMGPAGWALELRAADGSVHRPESPWATMAQVLRLPELELELDWQGTADGAEVAILRLATLATAHHLGGLDRDEPMLALLAWHVARLCPETVLQQGQCVMIWDWDCSPFCAWPDAGVVLLEPGMPVGVSRSMGEVKHYLGEFQAVLFRVQQLHGLLQLACEPTARTGPAKMAGTCSALLFWQLYVKVRRERGL